MLIRNHQQEGLCRAFIHAVASHCGMSISTPSPDYGIDLTVNDIALCGKHRIESGAKLDIQAKRATQAGLLPLHVRYDLDRRAYDALRMPAPWTPRLLVVLVLPSSQQEWLDLSEERLLLRHCAYWMSLEGWEPSTNRRSVRLSIPRANVFSPEALQGIMERVKKGEAL